MTESPPSCCNFHYEADPKDFKITEEELDVVFTDRDPDEFILEIKNETFTFTRTRNKSNINKYTYTCTNGSDEHAALLQRLFEQGIATVNYKNAEFFHDASLILCIPRLEDLSSSYMENGFRETPCVSILWNTLKWFAAFLKQVSIFTKIILVLWDLIGVGIILAFFFNTILMFATMGLYALANSPILFIFVLLPIVLYSLFFVNIMTIVIHEWFKFSIYTRKSPLSTLQILGTKFIKVTKWGNFIKHEYIHLGRKYDIFLGLLFVLFVIVLIVSMFTESFVLGVEVLIYIFAVILPPVKYFIIIILYSIHAYCSCFKSCRLRFLEINDYNDPFLNSLYTRQHLYQAVLYYFRNKKVTYESDHNNDQVDNNDPEEELSDISDDEVQPNNLNTTQVFNQPHEFTVKLELREPLKNNIWKCINDPARIVLEAVFSRNTASIFVLIAVIVYVIYSTASGRKEAIAEFFYTFIVYIIIVAPLSTFLIFPFFWIKRQKGPPMTMSVLDDEKEDLKVTQEYRKYVNDAIIWSKNFKVVRWSSMVITTLIVTIIFAYIIIAIVFSLNIDLTRDEIKIYSQPNATVSTAAITNAANISTFGFRQTLDPICYMQVKGLTTEQLIALADSAYYYTNDRKQLKGLLFKEYFGSEYVEDLVEIESPFPHALYKCSLCHYEIKSLNLTVFSIRGTKTMTDVLADVELWIGTVLIDAVMTVTPLVQTFALSSKAVIGSFMSLPRYIFHEFSLIDKYVGIFENYINSVNITKSTDALIVGHSLGGGLARILSLKTGMQAVAVSGPGISCVERYYYNHYKNIEPTVISINPRMDIVAMVDNFDDLTEFKVPCKSGLFKCHSVARTLCQTGLICGNGPLHEDYCGRIFSENAYKKMKKLAAPIYFGIRNG